MEVTTKQIIINVIIDIVKGIIASSRLDLIFGVVLLDDKIRNILFTIVKFNCLVYWLPILLIMAIELLFGVSMWFVRLLYYPINLFSIMFHIFHYMYLINNVSHHVPRQLKTSGVFDTISLAITMSIYSAAIYLSTLIISFLLANFSSLALLVNFTIMALYHSLYCFNNRWQYLLIKMQFRIDQLERLWPYYIGYGTIGSILLSLTQNPILLGVYNIYISLIIMIPFLLEARYPYKISKYPSINLSIFSHLMNLIVRVTKRFF